MKLKKQIASVLACGMLLASVPTEAMAYETPEIVRVGLESVCKNASSATIGVWDLYVGMVWDNEFEEGGMVTSNGTKSYESLTTYITTDYRLSPTINQHNINHH